MINHVILWLGQHRQAGLLTSGATLGVAGSVMAAVHRLVPGFFQFLRRAVTISVTIDGRSDLFEPMLLWLNDHPYSARCRRLSVSLRVGEEEGRRERGLVFAPAPGAHVLGYRGIPIWLERRRAPRGEGASYSQAAAGESLILTAPGLDRTLLRRLMEEATARYGTPDPHMMAIHAVDDYLEWDRLARVRKRPLASVVMPMGVAEKLLTDATYFREGADWHVTRGIPWRRGYLLYGPPGTGKTSLVKVLAGELGLDVAVISLSSPKLDDGTLGRLFANAPSNSVLLLEDVDSAFCQREHGEGASQVTFSGLLNAIDGVMSQEGHLLFMTTNHIERLDPALIRPGRIDVRIEIGPVDEDMARRMFLVFFPNQAVLADRFAESFRTSTVIMAHLQNHLLRHRDAPQDAAIWAES
ncbi:AAA family ATPase [Novacetimonas hansenii]|uniref:AAA family ATPase n=1 Tax=Novacetimonas hansenii TaxID=436 RepID=UPI00094FE1EE|nr:AAA family ATPase [Novacetimonas hansenii]